MTRILIVFIVSFFLAMAISPPYIFLMKKLKAKQTILSYVEQHKQKEGIPTMGGIIFLLALSITCLVFWEGENKLAFLALIITLVYGGIGALDDGIKILLKSIDKYIFLLYHTTIQGRWFILSTSFFYSLYFLLFIFLQFLMHYILLYIYNYSIIFKVRN